MTLQVPASRIREMAEKHNVGIMEATLLAQREEARTRIMRAGLPVELQEVLLWLVEGRV